MNSLPETANYNKQKQDSRHPVIPGGAYMISPLATVSVWAALKLKMIAWRDLRAWVALWEVRTWRDAKDPTQRNMFRFKPTQVARALGGKRSGSRLKKSLDDLKRLGLARLTSSDISFTNSLDDLPPELRAETERMLKSLGNENFTRALRMPRRLMQHIVKSPRPRPVRAAVILGMLLRTMMTKRVGWYKGCITTALLIHNSGFSESRIKHVRAALIREGFFRRLVTPARVRQLHGDWYELGQCSPAPSKHQNGAELQPLRLPYRAEWQPPITKPAPSDGIERNQPLTPRPGALRSPLISESTGRPSWHHIKTADFKEPRRRAALYDDACCYSPIDRSPAGRLLFYSAMARARRVGTINPCGMLRRIVETTSYGRYIADCDEEQARAWLSEERSRDLDTTGARVLLRDVWEKRTLCQLSNLSDEDAASSASQEFPYPAQPDDSVIARYFTRRLQKAGFPTEDAFNLIMTTHEGKTKLSGWSQKRWNKARGTPSAVAPGSAATHDLAAADQRMEEGIEINPKQVVRLALRR